MPLLQADVGANCFYKRTGKIVLVTSSELEAAERSMLLRQQNGFQVSMLTIDEAVDIEPALRHFCGDFRAAVYSASDEVCDSHRFAGAARSYLEDKHNVRFQLNSPIRNLMIRRNRVLGVNCESCIEADAVISCLGAWSNSILGTHGIHLPIYPVRGYSVTLPTTVETPDVSVTSLQDRLVLSRLGEQVRIAGFADFRQMETKFDSQRVSTLVSESRKLAPHAAIYDTAPNQPWGRAFVR